MKPIFYLSAVSPNDAVDALQQALSDNKYIIIGSVLLIIGFIVMMLWCRHRNRRNRISLGDELRGYFVPPPQEYQYRGVVQLMNGGVRYSRGNLEAVLEIPIEKETILAPFMTDPWFENRNYNEREMFYVLEDISHYLKENKITKKVSIITDEEYEELSFDTENDDTSHT